MWAYYAGDHTGLMLEFRCNDERDSPLLQAKVAYGKAAPQIYDEQGFAELLKMGPDAAARATMQQALFHKADAWAHEQEWRVVSERRACETGESCCRKFNAEDLMAVYYGVRAKAEDIAEIDGLLARYPLARRYRTSHGGRMTLVYQEVAR